MLSISAWGVPMLQSETSFKSKGETLMRKTVLTLCYVGATVWFSIAVLGWLGTLPPALHPELWPIAAFGGMALLTFGVLFHQKLGVLLLVLVGFIAAPLALQAQCRNEENPKECDLSILANKLTMAALPADPAEVVGHVFCAGLEDGKIFCGTVSSLFFRPSTNHLRLVVGDRPPREVFYLPDIKTWEVLGERATWFSITPKK